MTNSSSGCAGPVGVIGLGTMGLAVAERLAGEGIPVVATARSAASLRKVAYHPGIYARPNPAEVAAGLAQVIGRRTLTVFVSVPGAVELIDVVSGPAGLLAGLPQDVRLLVVDLSTIAPSEAIDMAAMLRVRGHLFVDAPVAGGPIGAATGTLSIMVGGEPDAVNAAEPWLNLLGTVSRCGPPGSGQVVKACGQLLAASGMLAVAEALTVAECSGVDPEAARTALLRGYEAAHMVKFQGATTPESAFTRARGMRLLADDIGIAQGLAARTGLPTPLLDTAGLAVRNLADLCLDAVLSQSAEPR